MALVTGIAFAVLAEYCKFSFAWLLLPVVVFACAVVGVCFKLKKHRAIIAFCALALFYVVGVLYSSVLIFNYCNSDVHIDSAVMIYGKVEEVGLTSKGTRYVLLSGVTFGETPVSGKLIAYFLEDAGEYCRRGYTVSLYSQPELMDFISDGSVSYYASRGIKYSCVVAGSLQAKYSFSLFGEIANKIEQLLFSNMEAETASVALALLTGNADKISSGTLSAFRGGGIAHAFAVSGLHVGVIYGAISALFKRLPINKYISVAIRLLFIFAFVGVCNFTPSSMRAAIMCAISAIASCIYYRYDSLNGVSLAAIIILLINPFSLFEIGFALSFGAVLGIFLLNRNFYAWFKFLPKKLRSGIATGWASQFITIPTLATSFGSVSWAGLILNLVFVPVISAYYILLFAAIVICLILPFCAPALYAVAIPLELIINIVVASGMENAVISCSVGAWIYLPFVLATVAMSDKFNIKGGVRLVVLGLVCVIALCASISPSYGKGSSLRFAAATDGGYLVVNNSQGNILVVTQNVDGVPQYFVDNSQVLIVVGDDDSLESVINIKGNFKRIRLRAGVGGLHGLSSESIVLEDSFVENGVEFLFKDKSLYIATDGVVACIAYGEKGELYGNIPNDCSLCLYAYDNYNPLLYYNNQSYDLSYCGKMQFNASYGSLTAQFVVPKE